MTVFITVFPWLLTAILAALLLRVHLKHRSSERAHALTSDDLARTNLTLLRVSQAVESASDAIGIGDMDSETLYINRSHIAMFGHSVNELNNNDEPAALFADKVVALEIHQSIRRGVSWHGETDIKTREGRVIPAFVRADIIRDADGAAIGIFGVFTDISSRRAAERVLSEERERSSRAQRLESLGMLAGGVAHDFGNLLTIIIGNAGLVRMQAASLPANANKWMGDIESAAWRAQELSKNLLAFARGSAPHKKRLALAPLITEAARGAVMHSQVDLIMEIASDLDLVEADPVQIDQVISNLCVNAVQAMCGAMRGAAGLDGSGGSPTATPFSDTGDGARNAGGVAMKTLTVVATNSLGWAGNSSASPSGSPFPGKVVRITITDTGAGIPAELLPRIWEPFFTTKAKGTGLGLATVYAVVKKHGGMIDVESQAGKGTTFTLVLPAASAVVTGAIDADGSGAASSRPATITTRSASAAEAIDGAQNAKTIVATVDGSGSPAAGFKLRAPPTVVVGADGIKRTPDGVRLIG